MRNCFKSTMQLLTVVFLLAGIANADVSDAQRGFEKLKSLAGKWTLTEEGKEYLDTFEVVARGNAVMERNIGYVTMFHLDGDYIMVTLYTSDGNQPRLRSPGVSAEKTALDFNFVDATNLKEGAMYVTGVTLDFLGPDELRYQVRFIDKGVKQSIELNLKRKIK